MNTSASRFSLATAFSTLTLGAACVLSLPPTARHRTMSGTAPLAGPTAELELLPDADPRLNVTRTLILKAQYARLLRTEERMRAHAPNQGLVDQYREAVESYNLVAREQTPEVFTATGLPHRLSVL